MSQDTNSLLTRFHQVLVEEIRSRRPDLLSAPFTVAEIYQDLVPYGTHRDRLGLEMNGDYEDLLLRLLAGEGDYLFLDSDTARGEMQAELQSGDPNTAIFREFAAVDVRLNPTLVEGSNLGLAVAVELDGATWSEAPPLSAPMDEMVFGGERPSDVLELTPEPNPAPVVTPGPVPGPVTAAATCHWCRAELPNRETLNYCPFCGTDVHVVPCPSCGEELEPNWRFCIACGAEVQAD
ncbi:MAG TPA: zinc ribbon domain-containing protein [Longimicrobiales bacterium]|jgi:hypothetical protein